MLPMPLSISVVIPLYNGQRFIAQALAGVADQTLPAHEVIVVDDGSTDDGLAVVEEFARTHPLQILRKQNGGQSSARNFGINYSTGTLIALLDQDDFWYPDHLEELVKGFAEPGASSLGWTYSNLDEIDENGRLITRRVLDKSKADHPKTDLLSCLRHDMFILPSASLISRQAFDAVGGFDERLSGYEDDDLFVRMFSAGYRNAYIDKPLSQWRIYASSTSFSPRMAKSRMIYARKLIDSHPNDVFRNICYATEAIVPRFMHNLMDVMRHALRIGDTCAADACKIDIQTLEGFLSTSDRHRAFRSNPTITAIIPLYNGAEHIQAALDSIFLQTLPPDEIIVVDDGSTDQGPAIVARMAQARPIRLLSKPNGGQSSARNYGIRHAHGDLIALLDQDDTWYASHLDSLVAPFRERRTRPLGWTYSDLDQINGDGALVAQSILVKKNSPNPKTDLSDCVGRDMLVLPSASVISRCALEAVGGFDERLCGYEDDDLFIRLLQAGYDNVYIETSLSRWRIYPESCSNSPRMLQSRRIYARKLIETFSAEPFHTVDYVRDLIAPRFIEHALIDAREALATADEAQIDACFNDLHFLEQYLDPDAGPDVTRRVPLITAVVPLFNGAPFIEASIQSILDQTLPADEIIVVDDGSTDQGPAIVARLAETHPIRLIHQENAGQSSARNIGVEHARGDLIAFLDQDDLWYADHLAELVKPFLQQRSIELGWSYSNLDEIARDGDLICLGFLDKLEARHPKRDIYSCIATDMYVLPSASLVSRRAFLSVGGFDERLSGYEDDDLFLRLFRAGFENVYLPRSLSKWRIYQTSSSYSPRMAVSRATYARKLIERYPNDPDAARYYVRDLIAPRFFRNMVTELRKVILKDLEDQRAAALANLRFIVAHLPLRRRLPLQLVFLPAMHWPPLARFIMRNRVPLAPVVRRVFGARRDGAPL